MGALNVNIDATVKAPGINWIDDSSLDEHMLGMVLVQQYNLKKVLELFVDQAEEATKNELQQIHEFGMHIPMDAKFISLEDKIRALSSLMFFVDKHNGRVKTQKCAVGSKQRNFPGYVRLDWAYPTVTADGVVITSTIEAHEGCDVAVVDLPNDFLNANNSEKTLVLLKRRLMELMVQIDAQMYQKYITTSSKGFPMLYICLSKALCGLLQSVLLFYWKLRTELEDSGFAVNAYNPCVANKMVHSSQITVTWNVDDLKISHKDSLEVTKFPHHFGLIYGERMTVHRGKVHDYLGMDLDLSTTNRLEIGIIKYIKKIHEYFP